MIPQVLIVRVAPQRIISGSDLTMNGDNISGTLYDTDAASAGLTKSYNVWGDDWSAE